MHPTKYRHGPLTRYALLWIVHAPGMPGTFSPPTQVIDHGTCVTHVPWCMPESLTSGFLRSRWRGKRSWDSLHMRNPQCSTSGKRPMTPALMCFVVVWYRLISLHSYHYWYRTITLRECQWSHLEEYGLINHMDSTGNHDIPTAKQITTKSSVYFMVYTIYRPVWY